MKSKANPSSLIDLIRARLAAILTRKAPATPQPPAVGWTPAACGRMDPRREPSGQAGERGPRRPGADRHPARSHNHAEPTITLDPTLAQRQRDQWAAHARTEATGD
jgi:hypothetical protein